jgi:hypothetical protein
VSQPTPQAPRFDAAYLRTLRSAVRIVGGEAALAAAWGVPREKLASWLSAEALLPVERYLAALDIVCAKGEPWKTTCSP